jgi:hypothetical protein
VSSCLRALCTSCTNPCEAWTQYVDVRIVCIYLPGTAFHSRALLTLQSAGQKSTGSRSWSRGGKSGMGISHCASAEDRLTLP